MRLALIALMAAPLFAQTPSGYKLVWSDEFNGGAGTAPDPKNWTYDLGSPDGWGNGELESYTNSTDNVYQDGNGNLVIKAMNPEVPPVQYSSGRIKTQSLFSIAYGRVEARIKIPRGQGMWPAFWMLGANILTGGSGVPWPACGEIDIMENIGREPGLVHGTVHGPGYSGANGIGHSYALSNNANFADDFHVYAVIWKPNSVQFLVDDQAYFTVTPASLPQGTQWVYDHPFFLLLNVAVGGGWPGYPDSSTVFPQTMTVDYVRVYRSTLEPIVEAGGVVDAALFSQQLAPGALASAFGTGLADTEYSGLFDGTRNAFPPAVNNIAVTVNSQPAPLTYVSEGQINFQIPWATPVNQPVDVLVTRNGIASDTQSITLTPAAPAVFLAGGAAIVSGPGPTYTMWGNGFGATASSPSDGVPFLASANTAISCTLTINNVGANVSYCGAAPGLVINQLNFEYPASLTPASATYPATLTIGNATGTFQIPAPAQ